MRIGNSRSYLIIYPIASCHNCRDVASESVSVAVPARETITTHNQQGYRRIDPCTISFHSFKYRDVDATAEQLIGRSRRVTRRSNNPDGKHTHKIKLNMDSRRFPQNHVPLSCPMCRRARARQDLTSLASAGASHARHRSHAEAPGAAVLHRPDKSAAGRC
jgi:hypothetical protein